MTPKQANILLASAAVNLVAAFALDTFTDLPSIIATLLAVAGLIEAAIAVGWYIMNPIRRKST